MGGLFPSGEDYSSRDLLPLQVVGMLSATVFALGVSFEVFALFSLGRNHQILILTLILCLSAWALTEAAALRWRKPRLVPRRFFFLLALQALLGLGRLAVLLWGPSFGSTRVYGVGVVDLGPLGIVAPIYLLVFFNISKVLLAVHGDELERAKQTIGDMERSVSRLTESLPVGTYIMSSPHGDENAYFDYVSQRFLEMTGVDRDVIMKDPLKVFECVHPDDRAHWLQMHQEAASTYRSFSAEGRFVVDGVVRWVKVDSVPREVKGGRRVWEGVVTDITDRVNAERQMSEIRSAQARNEERSRLLEEMHDGFGSQLQSARMLMQNGQLSQSQLLELVGECVDDLYLVVDLLSNDEQSLLDALIDYRYRMQYRTAGMACKLHWHFSLDGLPPLPQKTILQLLRITQEAIVNALKHASPQNITIAATLESDLRLSLSIADDGRGLPEDVKFGRGLNNMKKRARLVGAELAMKPNPAAATGTLVSVVLDLPVMAAKP